MSLMCPTTIGGSGTRKTRIAGAVVIAFYALLGILAFTEAVSAQSTSKEAAGKITFVCSTENAIERAAAAAERGNTEVLKQLHKSSACRASNPKGVSLELITEDPRVELQFLSKNAGGAMFGVYSFDFGSEGTAWVIILLNPELNPYGEA